MHTEKTLSHSPVKISIPELKFFAVPSLSRSYAIQANDISREQRS